MAETVAVDAGIGGVVLTGAERAIVAIDPATEAATAVVSSEIAVAAVESAARAAVVVPDDEQDLLAVVLAGSAVGGGEGGGGGGGGESESLVIYWTESGPAANVAEVTFAGNNVSQYSTLTLLGQPAANAINNTADESNQSRYVSSALPPQWRLGSGDWTIECFGRLTDDPWNSELGYATVGVDIANNSTFFSSPSSGDNAAGVFFEKSETIIGVSEIASARATFNDDASAAAISASADSDTSLHHISIQKSGSLIIIHYQGINNGLSNAQDDPMPSQYDLGESYILLAIGGAVVDGPSHLGVALGQIRITPGVARYGSGNFTPPSTAFYIPPG